jgi:hypothetical protein
MVKETTKLTELALDEWFKDLTKKEKMLIYNKEEKGLALNK